MLSTRWQPLQEMHRLRDDMERLFGQYGRTASSSRSLGVYPPLNVWQDNDAFHVEAELPGFELEALEIYVTGGNQLTISGERQRPDVKAGDWHRQERAFGKFRRTLELPNDVACDKVTATLKDGVLTISLPKSEEVKPRRIKVKAH